MPDTVDDLYARWQHDPADAAMTAALCEALRGTRRPDLVEIVGGHAAQLLDVRALVAAARMYSAAGRLDDAQAVLVSAGRLAPREGDVYRWLGEVLLRRGDAERAEKVLERAVQFGSEDPSARGLLDRARGLLPTQRSGGMDAVAAQVARLLDPARDERGYGSGNGRGYGRQRVEEDAVLDDLDTQIRERDDVRPARARPVPERVPLPMPAYEPPPPSSSSARTGELPRLRADSVPDLDGDGVYRPPPQTSAVPYPPAGVVGSAGAPPSLRGGEGASIPRAVTAPHAAQPAVAPYGAPAHLPRASEPVIPQNPMLARPRPPSPDGRPVPEPRDVLEALQLAGVFEPDGAVRPDATTWERAPKAKRRFASFAVLVTMAVLFASGVTGTFLYVKDKRAKAHVEAEGLLAKVDADLRASDAKLLEAAERAIGRAFDLDSRSPHASLTWARERLMLGLLKGGENVAFEDATQRAKEVGIPDKQVAFAQVASFLFQGDTAGAAAAIAKADGAAQGDAYYQLAAGATFERAGDARALERYAAAAKLEPELFLARVLLARATAVDGDPRKAFDLAKEIRAAQPSRAEGAAVVALAWARDARRGEAPAEVKEITGQEDALPVGLKAVPHAARAILALEQHKLDEARPALQKGLALADTPGVAAWLGGIALSTGDEALARKGALAAVSYSAVYPPARVLAARVALLGARLDEAAKATEDLPAASPDVAVVAAAVAYEKLDTERLGRALDPVPEEARKLPFVLPLQRGAALLEGRPTGVAPDKLVAAADDDAPWADLVAMDQALDTGDLESAAKIAELWRDAEVRPLRAVRVARLARWQGKNEAADALTRTALERGTVTPRALAERVFALVAASKAAEAVALFKTYPNAGGAATKWLRAYALASNGEIDKARSALSNEDPPASASLPIRVYATMAYGAARDVRHGSELGKALVQGGFVTPDVGAAAEKLGLGKLTGAAASRRR
jgi:Flp pilus assembly protein TadD